MYDEFFTKAHELLSEGRPFATAIVVRAEKPTSAKPGDKAIVTPEGVMHGWIGGSCAQPTVIQEAMKALANGEPRLIRLSTDPQPERRAGLVDLPMTCFSGGTLEIYIEPQLPPTRLMIIGSLPVAQALARLGQAMNYHVVAVDPDHEGVGMTHADEIITDLKQIGGKITPLTYIIVASHGHYDELALEYALRSKAAYVALVASKTRAAAVLEYLRGQGLSEAELARLKYPAGLDIQALRGDEIALSIMAEIVQRRRNAEPLDVSALMSPPPTEAIDPVCGMTVPIVGAEHWVEYEGQTYYFCCAGCKESFEQDPPKYLAQPAPSGEAIDPVCGMTVDIATAKYMSEYQGQLYYFCAPGCKLSFDKTPQKYLGIPAGGAPIELKLS
ncbi:MAG: YHS domain-containing protein [Anaerolineales bacterium]|nr:YHS domain-containing protein [Anaerolineales bacterium]